jgi:hypothetical protein
VPIAWCHSERLRPISIIKYICLYTELHFWISAISHIWVALLRVSRKLKPTVQTVPPELSAIAPVNTGVIGKKITTLAQLPRLPYKPMCEFYNP